MSLLWDKIKKNLVDSFSIAIDKTEELTSVGRLKLEILQLEHRLDEKYAQLGRYIYRKMAESPEDILSDSQLTELRKEVKELEAQLNEKEKELCRIKAEDGIDFDS